MIKRILLPLDGSRFAEAALPLAQSLAAADNVELHLVLVHEALPSVDEKTYEELLTWARKGEDQYLSEAAALIGTADNPCPHALLQGVPAEAIAQYAKEHAIDLLVLSTHGWGVLLVRPAEDGTAITGIQSILVALDHSGFGEAVLPIVVDLALTLDAEIKLLQVVQPHLQSQSIPEGYVTPWDPAIIEQMSQEATAYVGAVAAGLRERGCQVVPRVAVGGVVADTILEQAEQEADIVALATHGKEGVARLLLGSVADKVIRGSRSAVLVARPQ
jgi:nucleotide-binding universal stress UspA family protein